MDTEECYTHKEHKEVMGLERGRVGKRPVLVFVVRRSSSIVLKST